MGLKCNISIICFVLFLIYSSVAHSQFIYDIPESKIVLQIYGYEFRLVKDIEYKLITEEKIEITSDILVSDFNRFCEQEKIKFGFGIWEQQLTMPSKIGETSDLLGVPSAEKGLLKVELPWESRLAMSGRKSVSLKYGNVKYLEEKPKGTTTTSTPTSTTATTTPSGIQSGFSIEQELQVRLQGKVGRRVIVNVDYDDTKEQQRDISVLYKGEGEELIQEANFGDITLIIPNTEFTGYNKKLFGAEIKAKYKKFYLTAIGAQTKGKTKTVTFKGGYTQVKTDVLDTSFIKGKYSSILIDNKHIPLLPGTEQIWVDDLNGGNNNYPSSYPANRGSDPTIYTQKTEPNGLYSLDYLHPGTDYTIDYSNGVITFNKLIQSNYRVVVSYKYSGGSIGYSSDGTFDFSELTIDSHLIQKDLYDTSHQLVNFYNLGNKKILPREFDPEFALYIYDANNQEVDVNKFPYVIDIDFGILKFTNNKPFEKDTNGNSFPNDQNAYHSNNPISRYKVHIEYKYKFRTYQLPNFNIVKYSEKISMDGISLTRELDYTIDYESGFMFFYNEEKVTEKTEITVTYEYMPFGGQFQSNLFGARGEYFFADKMSVGSTFLYTGAQKPTDIPSIGSATSSLHIYDADTKINLTSNQLEYIADGIGVSKEILPSEIGFNGEIAQSVYNPNTYDIGDEKGIAVVDTMEGVDNVAGFSTSSTNWFSSSMPAHDIALNKNNRADIISLKEVEDYGHDTSSTAGKKQLLTLDYDFSSGTWEADRYIISKTGLDYTRFNHLEMWINTDWGKNVDINIDLGVINEDLNGNGILDTEDKFSDGQLHKGYDTGIPVTSGGKIMYVGLNNNKLDTEDIDGNGRLDQTDSYWTYKFNLLTAVSSSIISRDLGSWKLIKIPLISFSAANVGITPTDRRLIKVVRIWLKSSSNIGSLTIESINVTGNKWELKGALAAGDKFDIKAISRDIDSNYIPLTEIYFKTQTDAESEKNREQALSISYTHSNENYRATKVYSRSQNFLEYENLRFEIFKRNTYSGDILFIRLGADESNYYQYNINLDKVLPGNWQMVNVPLDGSNYPRTTMGSPYLNNVKQISMGVISTQQSDGEIWVNNLRAADSKKKVGLAKRVGASLKYQDYFGVSTDYKEVDSRFTLLEDSSSNAALSSSQSYLTTRQTSRSVGVNTNAKPVDYVPISANWKRDELITDEIDKDDPSYTQIPEKRTDNYASTIGFRLFDPLIISTEGTYKEENLFYMQKVTTLDNTKNTIDTLSPKATYTLPSEIFSIPIGKNDFEVSYKYTQEKSKHEKFKEKDTYAAIREEFEKWAGYYEPFNGFNLGPSYSNRFIDRKGHLSYNVYSYSGTAGPAKSDNFEPQSHTKTAGFTSSYTRIDGFTPKLIYNGNVNRDYPRDELRPENSLEGTGELRLAEWWDALESSKPTLNYSHKITANALYDKYSIPVTERDNKKTLEELKLIDIWGVWPKEDFAFNSSQIITDSLSNRFKLLGAFIFSPRGSISNERNRQNKFLTKTNVLSAGSGLIWESPPFLRSFLNPTSWNNDYSWRKVTRKDTNDKITSTAIVNTGSSVLSFKPTEVLSGSLSANANFEDKEEGSVVSKNINYTPGIELNQDLFFAHPIKLPNFWPFNGIEIRLEQKLRFQEKFNVTITRNKSTGPTVSTETKTNLYTTSFGFQYALSQHVRIDFLTSGHWFRDEIAVGNSYDAFSVAVKLNATF